MPSPTPSPDRGPPPALKAITRDGVRYEARSSNEGVLFAVDDKSGKPLWQLEVYRYGVDKLLETDVQMAFFTKMELSRDALTMVIDDEAGVRHLVDLKARTAKPLTWPIRLQLVEAKRAAQGWSYRVSVEVTNRLTRVMKLDAPSVGEGSELSNNLFNVTIDGKQVEYRGMMAKRAPPKRFIELAPGKSWRTVIELGQCYPLPAATRHLEIVFEHRNHFSPNDFTLASPPLCVELPEK